MKAVMSWSIWGKNRRSEDCHFAAKEHLVVESGDFKKIMSSFHDLLRFRLKLRFIGWQCKAEVYILLDDRTPSVFIPTVNDLTVGDVLTAKKPEGIFAAGRFCPSRVG